MKLDKQTKSQFEQNMDDMEYETNSITINHSSMDGLYYALNELEKLSSLLKAVCHSCQTMTGFEVEDSLAHIHVNMRKSVEEINEIFDYEMFVSTYGVNEDYNIESPDTTENLDDIMQSWIKNDK